MKPYIKMTVGLVRDSVKSPKLTDREVMAFAKESGIEIILGDYAPNGTTYVIRPVKGQSAFELVVTFTSKEVREKFMNSDNFEILIDFLNGLDEDGNYPVRGVLVFSKVQKIVQSI